MFHHSMCFGDKQTIVSQGSETTLDKFQSLRSIESDRTKLKTQGAKKRVVPNLMESNTRISVNTNEYMASEKTHFNLTNLRKDLRAFTKPDYMHLPGGIKHSPTETRSVVSKFQGWLSVNDSQKLTRKNAPEIAKVPLSDFQKLQFKPHWMAPKVNAPTADTDELPSARNQFKKNARAT